MALDYPIRHVTRTTMGAASGCRKDSELGFPDRFQGVALLHLQIVQARYAVNSRTSATSKRFRAAVYFSQDCAKGLREPSRQARSL
jgi:hypothetical protein